MTTPEPLRAITVKQPWASLIAFAATNPDAKLVENLGRRSIGVESHEPYCELAARRLDQGALSFEDAS